jgi:hypothetical protein
MHASVVTGQLDQNRMSEFIDFWKTLRKECQAERGYLVIDRRTGEWMSLDLWKTEMDAQRMEKSGEFSKIIEMGEGIGLQNMKRRVLELVAEDAASATSLEVTEPARVLVRVEHVANLTLNATHD